MARLRSAGPTSRTRLIESACAGGAVAVLAAAALGADEVTGETPVLAWSPGEGSASAPSSAVAVPPALASAPAPASAGAGVSPVALALLLPSGKPSLFLPSASTIATQPDW